MGLYGDKCECDELRDKLRVIGDNCKICADEAIKEMAKAPENPTPSGQAESALLSAKDKALSAMTELAEEFRVLGIYHYEEMVRGQQQAIRGAVVTVENALSRST